MSNDAEKDDNTCLTCGHPKHVHGKNEGKCLVFLGFYDRGKPKPISDCYCEKFVPIPPNTFICPWCNERKPNKVRCSKGYCRSCSQYDF